MAPHSVHLDREETPCSGPETVPEEVVLGLLERVDTGGTIAAEWSATRRPTSLRSKELGFHLMASKELKFWLHGLYGVEVRAFRSLFAMITPQTFARRRATPQKRKKRIWPA